VPAEVAARAAETARAAVAAVGAVGSFGVEMFLARDGTIVVNELAPRVHNSGHYTIEGCVLLAVRESPARRARLAARRPAMIAPAAVMVNLLGAGRAPGGRRGSRPRSQSPARTSTCMARRSPGPGRKMGHVTALGATLDEALANRAARGDRLRFGRAEA